jgi:hypothetical protein
MKRIAFQAFIEDLSTPWLMSECLPEMLCWFSVPPFGCVEVRDRVSEHVSPSETLVDQGVDRPGGKIANVKSPPCFSEVGELV